jgi:predicted ABC-type transport system involved in lysophospholipase L1 biosynthesis ATPase subunit
MTEQALLTIEDLHLRIGTFDGQAHILGGIDLKVRPGERVAIVG